jgi:MarR family transcriptional regulator, 2-MHQ and catechol-resistance regulon repressor
MPTHYDGTPEEKLALDTFIKFTRASNAFETRLIRRNAMCDLTMSQFGVLETLLHLGPLSQTDLGSKLLRSGGNITLVIDNLEKRGLVCRKADLDDRRVSMVHLTPAGEELIRRIFPLQVQAILEELGVLSAAEQVILGSLCKKLGTHK